MISMKIEDIKNFMEALLSSTVFDRFFMTEAQVKTFVKTAIDGSLLQGWYSEQERGTKPEEYVRWNQVRPMVFQLVKGKQVPQALVVHLIYKVGNQDVGAIHIQYEEERLRLITAYSAAEFTLDKSAEFEWDEQCKNFLKINHLAFEEEK